MADLIEKILRHCGLWCAALPRAPPTGDLRVHDPDGNWERDSVSQEETGQPTAALPAPGPR